MMFQVKEDAYYSKKCYLFPYLNQIGKDHFFYAGTYFVLNCPFQSFFHQSFINKRIKG